MDEFNNEGLSLAVSIGSITGALESYIGTLEAEKKALGYNPFKHMASQAKKRLASAKALRDTIYLMDEEIKAAHAQTLLKTAQFVHPETTSAQIQQVINQYKVQERLADEERINVDFLNMLYMRVYVDGNPHHSKAEFNAASLHEKLDMLDAGIYDRLSDWDGSSFTRNFRYRNSFTTASPSMRLKYVTANTQRFKFDRETRDMMVHYEHVRAECIKHAAVRNTHYQIFSHLVHEYYHADKGWRSHRYNDLVRDAVITMIGHLSQGDIRAGFRLLVEKSGSQYALRQMQFADGLPTARAIKALQHYHTSVGHGTSDDGKDILIAFLDRAEYLLKQVTPKKLTMSACLRRKFEKMAASAGSLALAATLAATPAGASSEVIESESREEERITLSSIYRPGMSEYQVSRAHHDAQIRAAREKFKAQKAAEQARRSPEELYKAELIEKMQDERISLRRAKKV